MAFEYRVPLVTVLLQSKRTLGKWQSAITVIVVDITSRWVLLPVVTATAGVAFPNVSTLKHSFISLQLPIQTKQNFTAFCLLSFSLNSLYKGRDIIYSHYAFRFTELGPEQFKHTIC